MFNDKIVSLSIDQRVRVSFDPRSREFNGKWYTTLTAYEIVPIGAEAMQQMSQEQQQGQGSTLPPIPQKQALDDDLPF